MTIVISITTLEKAELAASTLYIKKFLKSGIRIYNSKVPEKKFRKAQTIARLYALQTNTTNLS